MLMGTQFFSRIVNSDAPHGARHTQAFTYVHTYIVGRWHRLERDSLATHHYSRGPGDEPHRGRSMLSRH